MRHYDLSVFFSVSDGEDQAKKTDEALVAIIGDHNGVVYKREFLGKIELANTFKKHSHAYATRIQYGLNVEGLHALDKAFRVNENIIRHMNTRLESVVDEKTIQELTALDK